MPFDATQIAEDEALIARATPGPWQARFMFRLFRAVRDHATTLGLMIGSPDTQDWPDAEFCAEARTRWPLYVEEVKRLMKRDEPVKVSIDESAFQCNALSTELSALRTKLEKAERDELHEIEQRDYREEKFNELVGLFGDVQTEYSNLRGFDEIIADCELSLKVRNDAITAAYEQFQKIATFIPATPQSHEDTLEEVTMMADAGEKALGEIIAEWERINGEIYPHTSIEVAMRAAQVEPNAE